MLGSWGQINRQHFLHEWVRVSGMTQRQETALALQVHLFHFLLCFLFESYDEINPYVQLHKGKEVEKYWFRSFKLQAFKNRSLSSAGYFNYRSHTEVISAYENKVFAITNWAIVAKNMSLLASIMQSQRRPLDGIRELNINIFHSIKSF